MPPNILRLAFTIEFLIALVAIFETWSMVGGQGHLDLMPWYAKLGFVLGLSLTIVMATMSAMAHEGAWNAKTVACLVLALLIIAGMGATTYYYHLHENDDQSQGTDQDSLTLLYDFSPERVS
jgi:heme/copper-type cytochrome/quinol oxidase subunit 4